MSALTSTFCRQAARSLRPRPAVASSLRAFRPAAAHTIRPIAASRLSRAAFSTTMPTRADNATAVPGGKNEFDPEVVDVASYVHNHKIDSDLAVSLSTTFLSSAFV